LKTSGWSQVSSRFFIADKSQPTTVDKSPTEVAIDQRRSCGKSPPIVTSRKAAA
jgi:hypothetical protein